MSVIVIATAFPAPGHRDEVIADLRAALADKLTSDLDVQVLVPHPAGKAQLGTLTCGVTKTGPNR